VPRNNNRPERGFIVRKKKKERGKRFARPGRGKKETIEKKTACFFPQKKKGTRGQKPNPENSGTGTKRRRAKWKMGRGELENESKEEGTTQGSSAPMTGRGKGVQQTCGAGQGKNFSYGARVKQELTPGSPQQNRATQKGIKEKGRDRVIKRGVAYFSEREETWIGEVGCKE